MPNYKANIFFTGNNAGWSETFYKTATDPDKAFTAAQSLVTARLKILCIDYKIVAVRISDELIQRDSLLDGQNSYGGYDKLWTGDVPWNAMLCRLGAGSLYWRPLYLRGVPDVLFNPQTPDEVAAQADWQATCKSYLSYLRTATWQMKVLAKPPGNPNIVVVSIGAGGAGQVLVTTATPHGLVVGDKAAFYNIKVVPLLGQRYVVTRATDTTFEVKWTGAGAGAYSFGGYVRKVAYLYPAINEVDQERVVHRIVGRPFNQQRGRRRSTPR